MTRVELRSVELVQGVGPPGDGSATGYDTVVALFSSAADIAIKAGKVPVGSINIALTDDETEIVVSALFASPRYRRQFPALTGGEAFAGSMQEAQMANAMNTALARRGLVLATGTLAADQVVLVGYVQ